MADRDRQLAPDTASHFLKNQTAAVTAAAIGIHRAGIGLEADFRERALEALFSLVGQLQCQLAFGQPPDEPLKIPRQFVVRGMGNELVEVARDGADVFRNAPFIVIENANETPGRLPDII